MWHKTALMGMDDPHRGRARSTTGPTGTAELAKFTVGLEKKEIPLGG